MLNPPKTIEEMWSYLKDHKHTGTDFPKVATETGVAESTLSGWIRVTSGTATDTTSLTISDLDLSTDKHYMVVVNSFAHDDNDTADDLRIQINGQTGASDYSTVAQAYRYELGGNSAGNIGSLAGYWKLNTAGRAAQMAVVHLDTAFIPDSGDGATRVIMNYHCSGHGLISGGNFEPLSLEITDGAGTHTSATNVTSIKFFCASAGRDWQVWIMKPRG